MQAHIIETQTRILRHLASTEEAPDCVVALPNSIEELASKPESTPDVKELANLDGEKFVVNAVDLFEENMLVVAPATKPLPHTSHVV